MSDEYTPSMGLIRYVWGHGEADRNSAHQDVRKNFEAFDRALEAEVARRVADAKAEIERLEIWKQVATILLEKVKVNGKPALEIFDTGLAVQQKGESND